MWGLVKAIMSATQDPSPGYMGRRWGDGGQAAMMLLMDIVFRHYEPVARHLFGDRDGYWSPYLAKAMTHRLETAYRVSDKSCIDDICARAYGSCLTDIDDQLINAMSLYKETFIDEFVDENGRVIGVPLATRKPGLAASRMSLSSAIKSRLAQPRSILSLQGDAAKRFADAVSKSSTRAGATTTGQRALLAAAGLSGSYLLFRGAKWAQHRRRS